MWGNGLDFGMEGNREEGQLKEEVMNRNTQYEILTTIQLDMLTKGTGGNFSFVFCKLFFFFKKYLS